MGNTWKTAININTHEHCKEIHNSYIALRTNNVMSYKNIVHFVVFTFTGDS